MKPCNRHIYIDPLDTQEEEESLLILPEDYTTLPPYMLGLVLDVADDCQINIKKDDIIVVDTSMIQHVEINEENFHLVLENYVMGVLE
mgnify:CR=1 FL=1|tara:strand:+ start:145 stop:408 length:264 start_codon:yes stop_codon:yes gene_type:complete